MFDADHKGEYKANMQSAAAIRLQVESALARRIPAALTPAQRQIRSVQATGVPAVDDLIGGFPQGAITELTGPESSGRVSLALAFLARITQHAGLCAWIDTSDMLHGESAASAGVDLTRLLWVRSIAPAHEIRQDYDFAVPKRYMQPREPKRGLHGGGFGQHPRTETNGLHEVMGELFPHEPQRIVTTPANPARVEHVIPPAKHATQRPLKPWNRIEQALKATDLILHTSGFSTVVLDLGDIAPEYASRIELSTWFRYRAAVERSQACFVLITKHPCVKGAGELLLRLYSGEARGDKARVFAGTTYRIGVERRRFADNVVTLKKPVQNTHTTWKTRTAWEVYG